MSRVWVLLLPGWDYDPVPVSMGSLKQMREEGAEYGEQAKIISIGQARKEFPYDPALRGSHRRDMR